MWAKLVAPIASKLLQSLLGVGFSQSFVSLDTHLRLRNVIGGNKRRLEWLSSPKILGLIGGNEIKTDMNFGSKATALALQYLHGTLQQLAIQIKTNVNNVTT